MRRLFTCLRDSGDPQAREALIRRFLPIAHKLARRYYSGGEPLEDLVQVASVGLVKAVDRFDLDRGVSFTSYAVPTIMGELRRYFRDNVWSLHVPRGMRERAIEVHHASRELSEKTGSSPSVGQLAERLGLSKQGVLDGLQAYEAFDALSLDAPATGQSGVEPLPRMETIGSRDPGFELVVDRQTVGHAVRKLPPKSRVMLRMRYLEDRTQADIADRLGISQMQVSRILARTIDRLQRSVELSVGNTAIAA